MSDKRVTVLPVPEGISRTQFPPASRVSEGVVSEPVMMSVKYLLNAHFSDPPCTHIVL